jgi:dinuclear metal center YbgI/SA1388 family protein
MSISSKELSNYLHDFLEVDEFHDYCPNGLQLAGCDSIQKIISGVSACQYLFDIAQQEQADAVLVHHGFFWQQENPCITGIKRKRLGTLIKHDMNLLAYHLPLDAHPVYGNNVQLAAKLNLDIIARKKITPGTELVLTGKLKKPMLAVDFTQYIAKVLHRKPLHIPGNVTQIEKIAWCTGGAQDYFAQVISLGVDAYLTGEISEKTVHIARETGVHFIAAGHHATERYGVQALGEHLAKKFGLEHKYIEIDNPV